MPTKTASESGIAGGSTSLGSSPSPPSDSTDTRCDPSARLKRQNTVLRPAARDDRLMSGAGHADEPIELCARGEAAWQAVAYATLGAAWTYAEGIAWGRHVPHRLLLGAITLHPLPALPEPLAGTVRDSWGALGPQLGAARRAERADPWMLRAAGACAAPAVPGLTIQRAGDAELFERIAFLAASGTPPERPGELHPHGSENTPGLHLLLASLDDQPVGSALALIHDRGLFISAVAVLAAHRGKGIGTALTAAAINCAPHRPATLSTSRAGLGIYQQLGFEVVATPLDWKPADR